MAPDQLLGQKGNDGEFFLNLLKIIALIKSYRVITKGGFFEDF